jgi:hypothetical protein
MEGDIQFDHDHEVSLHLVGPVIKIFWVRELWIYPASSADL